MDDVTPEPAAVSLGQSPGRISIEADQARHMALVELGRIAASLRRMESAGACLPDVERLLADVETVRRRVRGEWDG